MKKRYRVSYMVDYYGGPGNHCNGPHGHERDFKHKEAAEEFAAIHRGEVIDLLDTVHCETCKAEIHRTETVTEDPIMMCQACYSTYTADKERKVRESYGLTGYVSYCNSCS
jgi:hypothetical protein